MRKTILILMLALALPGVVWATPDITVGPPPADYLDLVDCIDSENLSGKIVELQAATPGGTTRYYVGDPVSLSLPDEGSAGNPTVFRGRDGDTIIIQSARSYTGWEAYPTMRMAGDTEASAWTESEGDGMEAGDIRLTGTITYNSSPLALRCIYDDAGAEHLEYTLPWSGSMQSLYVKVAVRVDDPTAFGDNSQIFEINDTVDVSIKSDAGEVQIAHDFEGAGNDLGYTTFITDTDWHIYELQIRYENDGNGIARWRVDSGSWNGNTGITWGASYAFDEFKMGRPVTSAGAGGEIYFDDLEIGTWLDGTTGEPKYIFEKEDFEHDVWVIDIPIAWDDVDELWMNDILCENSSSGPSFAANGFELYGDWNEDPVNHKLYVYWPGDPDELELAVETMWDDHKDALRVLGDYYTFQNLHFAKSGIPLTLWQGSTGTIVEDCHFYNNDRFGLGIRGTSANNTTFTFRRNHVYLNGNGIDFGYVSDPDSVFGLIDRNIITQNEYGIDTGTNGCSGIKITNNVIANNYHGLYGESGAANFFVKNNIIAHNGINLDQEAGASIYPHSNNLYFADAGPFAENNGTEYDIAGVTGWETASIAERPFAGKEKELDIFTNCAVLPDGRLLCSQEDDVAGENRMYVSSNDGDSWTLVDTQIGGVSMRTMYVDDAGQNVYVSRYTSAADYMGLYRASIDDLTTWTKIFDLADYVDDGMGSLWDIDEASGGTLYISAYTSSAVKTFALAFKCSPASLGSGTTTSDFELIFSGTSITGTSPATGFKHIHSLAVDPNDHIWVCLGDNRSATFKSADDGVTWEIMDGDIYSAQQYTPLVFGNDFILGGSDYLNTAVLKSDLSGTSFYPIYANNMYEWRNVFEMEKDPVSGVFYGTLRLTSTGADDVGGIIRCEADGSSCHIIRGVSGIDGSDGYAYISNILNGKFVAAYGHYDESPINSLLMYVGEEDNWEPSKRDVVVDSGTSVYDGSDAPVYDLGGSLITNTAGERLDKSKFGDEFDIGPYEYLWSLGDNFIRRSDRIGPRIR